MKKKKYFTSWLFINSIYFNWNINNFVSFLFFTWILIYFRVDFINSQQKKLYMILSFCYENNGRPYSAKIYSFVQKIISEPMFKLRYWTKLMIKAQCLWDVAIKMNSSIDSTNVQVANLKPLYWTPMAVLV